jgi:hypothetical protein
MLLKEQVKDEDARRHLLPRVPVSGKEKVVRWCVEGGREAEGLEGGKKGPDGIRRIGWRLERPFTSLFAHFRLIGSRLLGGDLVILGKLLANENARMQPIRARHRQ